MKRRVFSTHGYPLTIVNDHVGQMTSTLWKRLCKQHSIKVKFLSAHYSETDSQTENANKVMKNYLQTYVNHAQDDWVDYLPMAKFSANNHTNESTRVTPFFANNDFHLYTGIELPQTFGGVNQKAELLSADKILTNQQKIASFLQDQLVWAQKEQAHWANQNWQPHPGYKVGDMIYVDARHFVSKKSSKSLSMKIAGPWKIFWNIVNKTYKLEIPQLIKEAGLTPIFHP